MSKNQRFGVSISYYGGVSWEMAELERELSRRGKTILGIRGCAYPEMALCEQMRRVRKEGVETVVLLDASVAMTADGVEALAAVAEEHGAASVSPNGSRALEAFALRRDVLEAMVRRADGPVTVPFADRSVARGDEATEAPEEWTVKQFWEGELVRAVPLGSPWGRDGEPLIAGRYLTPDEAFVHRIEEAGARVVPFVPDGFASRRRPMRTRVVNAEAPLTDAPGSQFALCIPTFGALDYDQMSAVFALEQAGMMTIGMHDCPWIDQARSWLTERALEAGRGVFFLDHDIMFHPDAVLRLCKTALEHQALVSAVYCMRKSGANLIGNFDVAAGKVDFFKHGRVHPAFYTGLGFSAIPRGVLESIDVPPLVSREVGTVRPWYGLSCTTGFYAGEDVSFCNRVTDFAVASEERDGVRWQRGASGRPCRVFLDTRIRVAHRGSYDYVVEDVGMVVPWYEALDGHIVKSRAEAKKRLLRADELHGMSQ